MQFALDMPNIVDDVNPSFSELCSSSRLLADLNGEIDPGESLFRMSSRA